MNYLPCMLSKHTLNLIYKDVVKPTNTCRIVLGILCNFKEIYEMFCNSKSNALTMASICVRGSSLVARSKIGEAGSRFWIVVSKVVLMDSDKTSHHWLIRGMYTILGEVLIASRNICKQDALIICI